MNFVCVHACCVYVAVNWPAKILFDGDIVIYRINIPFVEFTISHPIPCFFSEAVGRYELVLRKHLKVFPTNHMFWFTLFHFMVHGCGSPIAKVTLQSRGQQ